MRVILPFSSFKASRFVFVIMTGLSFAVSAWAQSQAAAADLAGTVSDPNGAVISAATVHARGIGTGISRTVTTNGDGSYQIIGLPPGEYEVTADAANLRNSLFLR